MYAVKCSFTNKFGAEFSWDFQIETDDYAVAMKEAVLCFWSGLSDDERRDASETLLVSARPNPIPYQDPKR
jgi:hypothetical protein